MKDSVLKKLGSAQDNFFLEADISRINIMSDHCKIRILSYSVNKDSCGVAVNIYGIIITELVYIPDNKCKRCEPYYITPFNQCIYLPNKKCRISTLSVYIQNKYFNKVVECSIAAFFTLMFEIRFCSTACDDDYLGCADERNDCKCADTVTVNCDIYDNLDCCEDPIYYKEDNCKQIVYKNNVEPINYNNQPSKLKNDMYKYFTSFQQNNRL